MAKPKKSYIYAKPGTTVRPGATEPTLMKVRNLANMRHIPPYGEKLELVTDGQVTDSMPFDAVLEAVTGLGEELAGVMHSEIADTYPGLDALRRVSSLPLGAWPNSGHFEPPNWQFDEVIAPDAFAEVCADWVGAGIKVVGGCCGLGPDHIRAAAERLT